jgi:hypothetical protein
MCQVCKVKKPQRELLPAELVRPAVSRLIEREHPEWKPEGFICATDLNGYRMAYVRAVLEMVFRSSTYIASRDRNSTTV